MAIGDQSACNPRAIRGPSVAITFEPFREPNQSQSVAISRNQSQSVAITCEPVDSNPSGALLPRPRAVPGIPTVLLRELLGELELAPDEGRNRAHSGWSSGAISEAREISSSESRDISLGISRSHPSKSNQRQSEVIRCNQISLDLARTLRSRTSGSCSASAARRARSRASRARDRSRSQIRNSLACSSGRGSRRKRAAGRRCVTAAQVRTSVDQNRCAARSAQLQCPSQRSFSVPITARAPVAQVPSLRRCSGGTPYRAHSRRDSG